MVCAAAHDLENVVPSPAITWFFRCWATSLFGIIQEKTRSVCLGCSCRWEFLRRNVRHGLRCEAGIPRDVEAASIGWVVSDYLCRLGIATTLADWRHRARDGARRSITFGATRSVPASRCAGRRLRAAATSKLEQRVHGFDRHIDGQLIRFLPLHRQAGMERVRLFSGVESLRH